MSPFGSAARSAVRFLGHFRSVRVAAHRLPAPLSAGRRGTVYPDHVSLTSLYGIRAPLIPGSVSLSPCLFLGREPPHAVTGRGTEYYPSTRPSLACPGRRLLRLASVTQLLLYDCHSGGTPAPKQPSRCYFLFPVVVTITRRISLSVSHPTGITVAVLKLRLRCYRCSDPAISDATLSASVLLLKLLYLNIPSYLPHRK